MRRKFMVSKVLTVCVTAAFLLSILLIGVPVGLTAAASTVPFARTVIADWDTVIPTSQEFYASNTSTSNAALTVAASPSGYGNGMSWGRTDLTKDQSQINHVPGTSITVGSNKALVFWISVEDAGASPRIRLFIDDISTGSGVAWTPKANAPFTVVQSNGVAMESTLTSQNFALPAGVTEGWVVIPFSSLQKRSDDGTTLPETAVIRNYNFYYQNANVTGTIYLDEICMVTDPDLVADKLLGDVVADFDTILPTDTYRTNAATAQVSDVSPYGTALRWQKSDATVEGSQVNLLVGSTGNADNTALVFWMSLAESDGAPTFRLTMTDGAAWYLEKGKSFWTIGADGTCKENTIFTAEVFKVDIGFTGWVIVPFDSFVYTRGRDDDPNLHPENISSICLYYSTLSTSGPIYLDQFGFTKDPAAFMEAYGNYVGTAENAMLLQAFDTGTVGSAAGTDIVAYTSSSSAQLTVDSAYSDTLCSLQAQLTGSADIHIPLNAETPSLLSAYKGVGFWIRTEDTAVTFAPKLVTDGGTLALNYTDPHGDIYRLADESTGETNAYLLSSNTITVPANFSGFVIVETKSFATGKTDSGIDMTNVEELVLSSSAGTFRIDTVQAVISAARFVLDDIDCKQDDDLIFAIADGWTVNDANNAIIPVSKAITSTQFRSSVAVRSGYRAVFLDSDRYQIFGALSSMEDVAYVDVFLGGTVQATYSFGPLAADDEQDDTTPTDTQPPCDGFTSLLNGETAPVSYRNDGGTMVREQSPSYYGKGFSFTVTEPLSETASMKLSFAQRNAAVSTQNQEAIAFWVSVPQTGYETVLGLAFTAHVDSGHGQGADYNWMPYTGYTYYTVDGDGTVRTADAVYTDAQGGTITLSDGFSGWVILPFSSLKYNAASDVWGNDPIYQMVIKRIAVSDATAAGQTYYIDELGMIGDTETALDQLSSFYYPTVYNWDSAVGGNSFSATSTATSNAVAETEISGSGRGNGLLWTRGSGYTQSQINFSTNTTVVSDGGIAFWMSVDHTDNKQPRFRLFLNASVTTGDTTTTATWAPDSDSKLYAITADGTMTQIALKDQDFVVPVNFSGWVVIPFSSMTINNSWGGNVTFGETTAITGFNLYYTTGRFDPSAVHLDEVGFTDNAVKLAEQMSYNTKLNLSVASSEHAGTSEAVDLLRTARKNLALAADSTARKTVYDTATANLQALGNADNTNA